MGRSGRAGGEGLELQCVQAFPAHGNPQVLTAHQVPILAQGDLQAMRAVAPLMVSKGLNQYRFPGQRGGLLDPLLARLPGVVAAGRHVQHLAEPPHRVVAPLGGAEVVAAQGVGVTKIGRWLFLKYPAPAPAVGSGFATSAARPPCPGPGQPQGRCHRHLGGFLPAVDTFGVDVQPRAAAWVERLYSARRRALAQKTASYLRRLSGFAESFMTKERYHPVLSSLTRPPQFALPNDHLMRS